MAEDVELVETLGQTLGILGQSGGVECALERGGVHDRGPKRLARPASREAPARSTFLSKKKSCHISPLLERDAANQSAEQSTAIKSSAT